MPLTGSVAWPTSATRLAIALCAFALLATASATGDRPVAAADLSSQINANRSYMEYAQKTMRAQDQAILSIQSQRTGVKKAYKEARATLRQLRTWYKATLKMVATRQARLAEAEGRYASAAEAPDPKEYRDRVSKLRKDVRDALGQKQTLASRVRAAERTFKASRARLNSLNRAQKAAIARREGAEATLGARIVEMQRLAATRAETQSTVSLASGSSAFSWPTTGRIDPTIRMHRLQPEPATRLLSPLPRRHRRRGLVRHAGTVGGRGRRGLFGLEPVGRRRPRLDRRRRPP